MPTCRRRAIQLFSLPVLTGSSARPSHVVCWTVTALLAATSNILGSRMRFNDRPQRVNGKFYAIYWDDEGRYRHSLRTDDPAVARTTICEFIRHFKFAQSSKIGLTGRKVFDLYIEDRTV